MAAKPRRKVTKKPVLPALLPAGFTVDGLFKNKWMIGEKIGSGGCGVVYLAREATSRAAEYEYVMKVEFHGNGPLYTEMHFYQNIGKPEQIQQWLSKRKLRHLGMSACHGLGSFEHDGAKCRFLVLQRYGTDLQQYLDEHRTFNAKTAYSVALAVVDVLEYLHSCSYIHGDVKAANLLRGRKRGTENQIYLVDMGLATKYVTASGHRKETPDPKKAHNGTIEYTSRDSHRGTPCTRRSDFETLAYNLLMWLSGSLPWVGITDVKKVAEMKEKSMSDVKKFVKELFGGKAPPPGVMDYLSFVQNLGFEEDPDYDAVRKIFASAIKSSNSKVDGVLSFGSTAAQKPKASGSAAAEEPNSSSFKENLKDKKVAAAKAAALRPKRKREATPITLEPGMKPTPAMLEIMNKRKS